MNWIKGLVFIPALFFFGAALRVSAQSSVTSAGTVFAEVVPVFSATETSQLNFGKFSPGPQGGEIIITPNGTISVMGTVFIENSIHNPAAFYVTGYADAAYSISLPVNPVILTHTTSARTMLVDSWNSIPAAGIGTGMLKNGFQTVYIGATLKVGTLIDNPVGIYTGTFEITFDFN
jgi:Domain of unknown function (DUF4402)